MRQTKLKTNLILSIFGWFTISFSMFMMNFYIKYVPGNIFVNTIINAAAEALSKVFSGVLI